jgi:hypothetical protein
MGMGYAAAYADVVTEETIKKFCPKEFENLSNAIDDADDTWDNVAQSLEIGDDDEVSGNVVIYFRKLQKAFEKKTGLSLCIGYHSADDDGDRYDDIDGIYWSVDGMYQLTPAGKKMKKYVERKTFVQFG